MSWIELDRGNLRVSHQPPCMLDSVLQRSCPKVKIMAAALPTVKKEREPKEGSSWRKANSPVNHIRAGLSLANRSRNPSHFPMRRPEER